MSGTGSTSTHSPVAFKLVEVLGATLLALLAVLVVLAPAVSAHQPAGFDYDYARHDVDSGAGLAAPRTWGQDGGSVGPRRGYDDAAQPARTSVLPADGLSAPQTPGDEPCAGMLVYRVYGPGAGAGEFGASWSPIDPRSVGRERYRGLAGLPASNPGTHLVIGELIDPAAARIRPGGALPCGPPHCAEERPGGLAEYMIENNRVAVVNRTYVTLSPPY